MIYFLDKNGKTLGTAHNGDKPLEGDTLFSIAYAQADGDEMEKSCYMLGRPYVGRVAFFFNDEARFLAANWTCRWPNGGR